MESRHRLSSEENNNSTSRIAETVYTRNGTRSLGLRVWGEMLRNILDGRDILFLIMRRNITIRYRQSLLGIVWAIFPPLVTALIFSYLVGKRLLPVGETGLPYILFALWNLSVWHLFAGTLTAATNSLLEAGSLVTRINFSKDTLVFAALGQPLIDYAVRLAFVMIAFFWMGVVPHWQAVFIPLILLPVLLLALGAGFILSIANLVVRDIGNALGVVLSFAVFLAPVLYPPPVEWPFVLVNFINPISPLLIAMQDLLNQGELSQPEMFAAATLFSCLVFLMGWRVFYLAMPRVTERA